MSSPVPGSARSGRINRIILIPTVLCLVLILVGLWNKWPSYSSKSWQEPTGSLNLPWHDSADEHRGDKNPWFEINQALKNQDKDAFLSFGEGQAREAMALWWDNSSTLGWDFALITPEVSHPRPAPEDASTVILASNLGFPASPPWARGNPHAGQNFLHAAQYEIEATGSGSTLKIKSLVPKTVSPLDESDFYAAKRENVILYGKADEKSFIDAKADEAQEEAETALGAVAGFTDEHFVEGFSAAVTSDEETLERWTADTSDFMLSTQQPYGLLLDQPKRAQTLILDHDQASVPLEAYLLATPEIVFDTTFFESARWDFELAFIRSSILLTYYGTPIPDLIDPVTEAFVRYLSAQSKGDIPLSSETKSLIESRGVGAVSTHFSGEDTDAEFTRNVEAMMNYFQFLDHTGEDPWDTFLEAQRSSTEVVSIAHNRSGRQSVEEWLNWVADL